MKVQCYAIFDTCAGIYEKPFFSTTDDMVKREFQDIAMSDEHPIAKHPEHYSLWRLGTFDNNTGKILDEQNECLWQAVEAIAQSQNMQELHTKMATETYKKLNGDPVDARDTEHRR